ncbi:MAG: bifunctional glutamate N-acetyltransferase/amino-acid acetyltransferase ArgJ [Nitrospirota bacterium]|nr:bifunctional glutamate N-acetyltransferase/amino-acid acetyltransferase ArgJ [Nitrospirota bacterium]
MSKLTKSKGPKGFLFSTAGAAIKKPGRKDIALIISEADANIAGTFTTNTVKAAPVKICMNKIKSGKGRVIVVNSGNANACTGAQGTKDANEIISHISKQLKISAALIYPCSTGVIGTPMPMERILPSLPALTKNVGNFSLEDVAGAIMTTDTFPKIVIKKIKVGNVTGTISGICKGAGMIAPNMATMLCYILTDIAVEQKTLNKVLKNAVNKSFNRITIDGDMSTNDTVLMMANGLLGNTPVTAKSESLPAFQKALDDLAYGLAKLVVKDGEGATKLVEVYVKGTRNERDAARAALSIANSSLVKTAIYGNDANWGRIMAALGYSGVAFREEKTDIYFNNIKVVKGGLANNKDREATEALKAKNIKITVNLHAGTASSKVLTCDLTEEYIRINAEYRT